MQSEFEMLSNVAFVAILIVIVIAIVAIGYLITQLIMKSAAEKALNIDILRGMRVWPTTKKRAQFTLKIPYWLYEKRDGTADRRRSGNRVIKPWSVIVAGGWRLKSRNPITAYRMAVELRQHHVRIPLIPEEQAKHSRMVEQAVQRMNATSIQGIVDAFATKPSDFEPFCARLLNTFGYRMTVTPPTNDGGYDLIGETSKGETLICECKCYSPNHSVGRPLIQKLVGANETVRAQRMFFITTSRFSAEAIEYARQTGVGLVDGKTLVEWCRQAWGSQPQQLPPESAGYLTREDLIGMLPRDMVGMF